ncbi:MAG TPA: LolA-related protein [Ramlibacter sp.]|nr:LolA-related protein [Ramlibacter sp.]
MKSLLRAAPLLIASIMFCAAGVAYGLTVPELQRLLQAGVKPDARYEEVRESPWLSSPVTTRGTLHVTPQGIEKRVETPRQETWRILDDRLEWIGPGDTGRKQILFSQAPALKTLADVTRRAVAGDIVALERDFTIVLRGTESVWSAQLQPRTPPVARQLESVELQGTSGRLRVLIVSDRQGERTTTRILP